MLKPFDLDKALRGAKVVTRDGREVVKVYHIPELTHDERVLAVVNGCSISLNENGRYWDKDIEDRRDLFLSVPEPREVKQTMWINTLASGEMYIHSSIEKAKSVSSYERAYKSIAEEVTVIRKVEE